MVEESTPDTIPPYDPWDGGKRFYGDTRASLPTHTDNFGRIVANPLVDLIEVAGDAGTPLTGPVEDDANTDSTGATTSNTTDNPGGYQIGRTNVTPQGGGTSTNVSEAPALGNRELYPGDIAIIWVDSDTAGVHEIDALTEQNS